MTDKWKTQRNFHVDLFFFVRRRVTAEAEIRKSNCK